jgi:PAS domain S-box-containing protein
MEDFYRNIIEKTGLFVILTAEGMIQYANGFFCTLLKDTADRLIAQSFESLIAMPDMHTNQRWRHIIAHKAQWEGRLCLQTTGEDVCWISAQLFPKQEDEALVFILIGQDITTEKIIQEQLVEAQQRIRLLLAATFESITFLDNGYCIEANEATTKLLGYSHEELIGMFAAQVIAPEYREVVRQNIIRQYELPYEVIAQRKDGSTFLAEIQGKMLYYRGKPLRVTSLRDITQQRQAENALRQSELNLQAVLSNTDYAVWSVDRLGRLIFFNQQFTQEFQFNFDTIPYVEMDLLGAMPKEAQEFYKPKFEKGYQGRKITLETKWKGLYFELSGYPIIEDKVVIGLAFHSKNVTERKQEQKKLIESLQALEEAQDFAHLSTWYFDLNTLELTLSRQLTQYFGLAPEVNRLHMREYERYIHPEDYKKLSGIVQKALKTGEDYTSEIRLIRPGGQYRWLYNKAKIIKDHEGKIIALKGIAQDIDKRKKSEEVIQAKEQQLRVITASLPTVALYQVRLGVDGKGRFTFYSENAPKIFGLEIEAILADNSLLYKSIHPDDVERLRNAERISQTQISSLEIEFRHIKPDGEIIWVQVRSEPTKQPDGSTIFNGVVIDITERIKTEQELRIANEELTKANQELDRFVYSASHDLRAPIASVLGLINLCRMTTDLQTIYQYLDMQEVSIKRLDSFIQDILDYSRNARTAVEPVEIDFETLIHEVFGQYSYVENAQKIEKIVNLKINTAFYTDKHRLSVILNNLISNSIRYSNPHQTPPFVTIEVNTNTEEAKIKIEDNGIGISKEHLEHVFEMFYRATNVKTGSGLGLYIVKETITKLNGTITINSQPNEGTAFYMTIPNLAHRKMKDTLESKILY